MAVNSEFQDCILKLCEPFAQMTAKSMFRGCGLYLGGIFFAILAGDTLFLKANDETRDDFIKADLSMFSYTAQGKSHSLSFYDAPEQALEEPEQLESWVRKAMAAGVRAAKKKAAKKTEKEKNMSASLIATRTENSDGACMGKHSVIIARHRTSVSLENAFWEALGEIAARHGVSRNRLIGIIDSHRNVNLSSAIRLYVLNELRRQSASV